MVKKYLESLLVYQIFLWINAATNQLSISDYRVQDSLEILLATKKVPLKEIGFNLLTELSHNLTELKLEVWSVRMV